MKLVIIAGGKGTRLGLKDIPKPMCPLAGKPLLEHQIELAKRYGLEEVFLLSGHLAHVIRDYFGDGSRFGFSIRHITEETPMGTAGCLRLLPPMEDRFMVLYGDVVMDCDLGAFMRFDAAFPDSMGTLAVHPNNHPQDSDLLELEEGSSRVTRILPKPHPLDLDYRNLTNAAAYVFSPAIVDHVAEGEDLARDVFPRLLAEGKELRAYATAEYLRDMGTVERLKEIERDWHTGLIARRNRAIARPAVFLDRDGVINPDMGDHPGVEKFQLLPGVEEAVRRLNDSDYLAVLVTNQPMIAKGFVTREEVEKTHRRLETLLGRRGAYLDAIFYCPHHPEKGFAGEVPELKTDCPCRKPKPGMLLEAASRFNIDLPRSWMVGDSARDMAAGHAAGCRCLGVGAAEVAGEDEHRPDLPRAVDRILADRIPEEAL